MKNVRVQLKKFPVMHLYRKGDVLHKCAVVEFIKQ